MSGYLRIGGALLMGTILVLGTFVFTRYGGENDAEANTVVSVIPTRTYVEEEDTDNDGIPNWEEELAERVTETIKIPENVTLEPRYEKPTTYTGQFAESFFTDYLNSKSRGDGTVNTEELVNSAVTSIERNTASKVYTTSDIVITENTPEAMREYGNEIARIMLAQPSSGENEIVIAKQAIGENNPEGLKKLAIPKASYKQMLAESLVVPTPATYAEIQKQLVTAYEAIYTDIDAMEKSFDDPLYAIARIKRYYDDATVLQNVVKSLNEKLLSDGIHFEEAESGSFFYTLQL